MEYFDLHCVFYCIGFSDIEWKKQTNTQMAVRDLFQEHLKTPLLQSTSG